LKSRTNLDRKRRIGRRRRSIRLICKLRVGIRVYNRCSIRSSNGFNVSRILGLVWTKC